MYELTASSMLPLELRIAAFAPRLCEKSYRRLGICSTYPWAARARATQYLSYGEGPTRSDSADLTIRGNAGFALPLAC